MNRARWRPSPLLAGSLLLHAGAGALLLARPADWPLPLGLLAADHALLTALGLWPRSHGLGPNWTRLPAPAQDRVALTIDDGPDPELTPRILDVLDAREARASFFCIGERARRYPRLVGEIVRRGHAVENHSQHHRHTFSLLGPRAMAREIDAAQATLAALAGSAPRFFRAPAGLRNPWLDPLLHARDLRLASWTRRGYDTRERVPARVLARLLPGLQAGDILLLHDGNGARTGSGESVALAVLPPLLTALAAAGLHSVTLRSLLP